MKLKFKDGRIEDASLHKDCNCCTHDGPHWIHIDDLDRERNRKILDRAKKAKGYLGAMLGCQGHSQEELARLKNKEYEMRAAGVVEIIREEGDPK